MRHRNTVLSIGLAAGLAVSAHAANCPNNMVPSGSTCVDRYEASVYKSNDPRCLAALKAAAEAGVDPPACAIQVAISGVDYTDSQCKFNGGGCVNLFAFSKAGVIPARSINYFIAAAACRNSGKRLPSNAEWQAAALGTPDPWPQDSDLQYVPAQLCNLNGPSATLTGSRAQCKSDVGSFDMVGNVIEFVADWGPLATTGANWDVFLPGFGGDISNMGGPPNGTIYGLPGTTLRGGSFAVAPNSGGTGARAGVYAIDQNGAPNSIGDATAAGFRCAK
jgi:formylglycine-generating enzyme required for sulfatase activity